MANAPKIVPVADDEFARQKAEIEARSVSAEVTGEMPIRDAVTRESVYRPGIVRLDPQTTMIDHLVHTGAVRLLPAKAPAAAAGTEG